MDIQCNSIVSQKKNSYEQVQSSPNNGPGTPTIKAGSRDLLEKKKHMMRSLYILGLFLGMYVCMSVPFVVVDFSSQYQRQSDTS